MDVGFVIALLVGPVVLAVIALIAWAAGSGRIGRNHAVGLRLPSLLSSDAAWRRGHRAAVTPAVAAVVTLLITSGAALLLRVGGVAEQPLTFAAIALMLVAVVLVTVIGARAARTVGGAAP